MLKKKANNVFSGSWIYEIPPFQFGSSTFNLTFGNKSFFLRSICWEIKIFNPISQVVIPFENNDIISCDLLVGNGAAGGEISNIFTDIVNNNLNTYYNGNQMRFHRSGQWFFENFYVPLTIPISPYFDNFSALSTWYVESTISVEVEPVDFQT